MSGPLRYQNSELQDRLASSYVTGTLRGRARQRMVRLMKDNAALRNRVRQWENKLQPLNDRTPSVTPKKETWARISEAINGTADPLLVRLKKWLLFYKALSGMAVAVALVAGLMLFQQKSIQSIPSGAALNYVAVMNGTDDQPSIVVTLTKEGRVMTLDVLKKPGLEKGDQMQLWAVSREDGQIRSLAAVELQKRVETNLTKAQWGLISSAEFLLVTPVAKGVDWSDTNPVLAKGLCVKVEGWKS